MKKYSYNMLSWFLFASFLVLGQANNMNNSTTRTNQDGLVQVLETEIWDASANSWIATGDRWTNERGQASRTPLEVQAPNGFDFDGEWKIVVSGGDSMGWEYQFSYLQAPKRRRIWLRSLKQQKIVVAPVKPRPTSNLSRGLARVRDDWNFKGFGVSVYKSFIFPTSFGVALRLPLTMNFDWWDRHPELPSVSSSVAFYFPWTIGAFLSTSVHVEWVKWVAKTILQIIPRLGLFLLFDMVLPLLWMVTSTLLLPFRTTKLPSIPEAPRISIAKPRYNPNLSERIGCSASYRWSKQRGLEWRFSYWHSYLPTLVTYRNLFRVKAPVNSWWQKHFGSIGLSSGYPIPTPPHVSCSACLSLSGLNFQSSSSSSESAIESTGMKPQLEAGRSEKRREEARTFPEPEKPPEPVFSARRIATTKAASTY